MQPASSSREHAMTKPPPSHVSHPHPQPVPHSQFPAHQSSYGYPTSTPYSSFPPPSSAPYQTTHSLLPQSQPLTSSSVQKPSSATAVHTTALQAPSHLVKSQPHPVSHSLPSNPSRQLPSSQQLNHLQTAKQPQQPPFSGGYNPSAPHSSALPAYTSPSTSLLSRSNHFPASGITPIHSQHQLPKQAQNSQDRTGTPQQSHSLDRQAPQPPQQNAFRNEHFFSGLRQKHHQQQPAPQQPSQLTDAKPPSRASAFSIDRPAGHSEPFPNSKSLPFPISHHPQPVSPTGQSPSAARPPNPGPSSTPLPVLSQPSALPAISAPPIGSTIAHNQSSNQGLLYDISKLHAAQCAIIGGKVYNDKGHSICGVLNQHDKPCKRIGKCPFHGVSQPVCAQNSCNGFVDESGTAPAPSNDDGSPNGAGHTLPDGSPVGASTSSNLDSGPKAIPKKQQYKHGWSKEEHFLFLRGLQMHDRGSWKQISNVVQSRNATQVQSHAQKYFLRQKQNNKNKRSIHDLTMDSPEMQELDKRFRSGEFRSVIPSVGLSENLYDPSNIDGGSARVREEQPSGLGQGISGVNQGLPTFGQSDGVGHNMMSETNLPRFGQTGGVSMSRLGQGQPVSATTLGSSVSSGVQIPQLHNANQPRGNYQGTGYMQPHDLLGHAAVGTASQKRFNNVSPMRPRADLTQTRDVLLSGARPAFPQDMYPSNLAPMQSGMSQMLPGAHGLSPKPGHKVIDPAILQPGMDRNSEAQNDHSNSQQIYPQNGFPGLYAQSSGTALFPHAQPRVGGDNQLAWPYESDTRNKRPRGDLSGKDTIALQNSFPGMVGDGFGNVNHVGGMPSENQVVTGFDGATNQHAPSFQSALFGGAEAVDVGDNSNAYNVNVNGQAQASGSNMGVRDLNVSMGGFGAPTGLQLGSLAVRGQGGIAHTFVRN